VRAVRLLNPAAYSATHPQFRQSTKKKEEEEEKKEKKL
jgi:hypothetical protein